MRSLLAAAVALALVAPAAIVVDQVPMADADPSAASVLPAVPTAQADDRVPAPGDNGFVFMVHGHFEPWPAGHEIPPVHEAAVTTPDNGTIRLHVIPYAGAPFQPTVVQEPELTITSETGDLVLERRPNADPAEQHTCEVETQIPNHEGPLEACQVYEIPTDDLPEGSAVTMTLSFIHQGETYIEPYSTAAHALLHSHMEGAPVTRGDVDTASQEPTPYVLGPEVPVSPSS